ncbi:MAG: Nre family DNA repair protein [Candidatus Methanofastidiosia archaeon]
MQKNGLSMCDVCKGNKHLCGRPTCPILERIRARSKILPMLSQNIFGSSPSSIFVGSWNYPKVYIGPLVPPIIGDTSEMDLPESWYGKSLEEIVGFRATLVRSKESLYVDAARDPTRRVLLMQDIVMSDRPVDTELGLKKKPHFSLKFSEFSPPFGPSEMLKNLDLAQNPHIPRSIDAAYNDDMAATESVKMLYDKGIEVSHISKLLSAGILGEQKKRKFVPTRWSITATDDILSKEAIESIKTYPSISECRVFYSKDIGNTLVAIFVPGIWSYEFLECWIPGSLFSGKSRVPRIISDWEYYKGRKTYADVITGAYYTGRLPVTEYLSDIKRQATCFVVMEVDPSYHTPIGVWRVRIILRDALCKKPEIYASIEEAFEALSKILIVPGTSYLKSSQLLNFTSRQKVLDEWM